MREEMTPSPWYTGEQPNWFPFVFVVLILFVVAVLAAVL